MIRPIFITILFLALAAGRSPAQSFHRISGYYVTKARLADSTSQLVKGKFYYDRNIKKIVYINSFPEKETWVTRDSSLYLFVDGDLVQRQRVPPAAEFTIFHLALENQLDHFGLKNTFYRIDRVEKQGDLVVTTWAPHKKLADLFGRVMISNKDRRIHGIVFFDHEGKLVKKQFFENFVQADGLDFPTDVVEIIYSEGEQHYRKTTYKNIRVNEWEHEDIYDYPLPVQ